MPRSPSDRVTCVTAFPRRRGREPDRRVDGAQGARSHPGPCVPTGSVRTPRTTAAEERCGTYPRSPTEWPSTAPGTARSRTTPVRRGRHPRPRRLPVGGTVKVPEPPNRCDTSRRRAGRARTHERRLAPAVAAGAPATGARAPRSLDAGRERIGRDATYAPTPANAAKTATQAATFRGDGTARAYRGQPQPMPRPVINARSENPKQMNDAAPNTPTVRSIARRWSTPATSRDNPCAIARITRGPKP